MKRSSSAADIDKLETDIRSIIYRNFPMNIKFINVKSTRALSFLIIPNSSITKRLCALRERYFVFATIIEC